MLKAAKREKVSQDVEGPYCKIGVSCMQGWRWFMEDAHAVLADLDTRGMAYVGVFDSHISPRAAQFCAQNMHARVLDRSSPDDLDLVLHKSFMDMDRDFRGTIKDPSNPDSVFRAGGCTATVLLLSDRGTKVTVAGVGDCRCVASRAGMAEELSRDHKPDLPDERERIEAAGGSVTFGRLKDLNVSRGIGDYRLKIPVDLPPERQQLSAAPEIREAKVVGDPGIEFVVVASDGVWECRSSQEVVDFVRGKLMESESQGGPLVSRICEELMDSCVKAKNPKDKDEPGTTDNITMAILVPVPARV
ncbi:probable protein phosphatase 2C 11 [Selaginella moellendorffii]|nr:probable protein phosphatase 2C 11 [Selaginella moellendorffii]|eukprot:XP_002984176.2 probable protein phosphatase 2C 11 [Selaginella moellendorffii]